MIYGKYSAPMLWTTLCVSILIAPSSVIAQDETDIAKPTETIQTTTPNNASAEVTKDKPVSAADTDGAEAQKGLRMNFRGASLDTVLDYLSRELGFIIVKETEIDARIDVWSYQPLNKEEAVELLNTVLAQNGYAAIRDGRTLSIVSREDAAYQDIPVSRESDPELIPKSDQLVTQIIPVRYAEAMSLTENLAPLLPSTSVMTANESSNSIVLTDTQRNVRRMAEIVKALDTSIATVSEIRVFQLNYADATEVAQMINQLYREQNRASSGGSNKMGQYIAAMRMRGFGGDGGGRPNMGAIPTGVSEARQAASMVQAVADERTNSLVISGPEDLMDTFEALIKKIDSVTEELTQVKVFPLHYADAEETAQIIEDVFGQDQQRLNRSSRGSGGFAGSPFFQRFMSSRDGGPGRGRGGSSSDRGGGGKVSERRYEQTEVTAVADTRTNSVIVTAAEDTMKLIQEMLQELDSDPAKDRKVFVYTIQNADPENVQAILENIFQNGTSGSRRTSSRTSSQRTSSQRSSSDSRSSSRSSGSSRSSSSSRR